MIGKLANRHKRRRIRSKKQAYRHLDKDGDRKISFSFAWLDLDHKQFFIPKECQAEFLHALFADAFANYSNMTDYDFRHEDRRQHRHRINFEQSTFENGFGLEAEDVDLEAWQFAVCSGRQSPPRNKWRVYGFLVENIFHVVWLDAKHAMFE